MTIDYYRNEYWASMQDATLQQLAEMRCSIGEVVVKPTDEGVRVWVDERQDKTTTYVTIDLQGTDYQYTVNEDGVMVTNRGQRSVFRYQQQ